MTVRGTRNLLGKDADELVEAVMHLERGAQAAGYQRFLPSLLSEAELFAGQMGDNRVFAFKDLGERELVLLPEVTAVVRREYREVWSKSMPKPVKVFYTSRCYRYDRPQRGRWREFTQFGVEEMPSKFPVEQVALAMRLLSLFVPGEKLELKAGVKRGLGYYSAEGFEIWSGGLQLCGGGPYEEGAGFAIGVERMLLVRSELER